MTQSTIHPLAVVDPEAKIGNNVTIEAYAIIKKNVTLEDNVVIKSHAYIDGCTTIGSGTVIWPFASVGTKTQDLKFQGETTYVIIGKNCEIREFVTINSSCHEGSAVRVGDQCLIMAYCHVAHNCVIGNRVIMANNAMLAGHVTVEDFAHDVPPYTLGAGAPYKLGGLNLVGLKRHGFPLEVRRKLARAFKLTYRSGLRMANALEQIENEMEIDEHLQHWLNFCKQSKRGLIGFHEPVTSQALQGEEFEELEELLTEKV
ncbi:MAG: UDP-N-acetylglucosamine O-acyltransferase [Chlamydiia bacterium]|nr:UDP-N-acetylglucosamine O-acyltransferase [Chlamydiia bacterium]